LTGFFSFCRLEIIGKYMRDATAIIGLLNLVKSGLLDLGKFKTMSFPLKDAQDALSALQQTSIVESVFSVN
jgi:threonine dehydrogenase-like Zn-dependent dehydrogenase